MHVQFGWVEHRAEDAFESEVTLKSSELAGDELMKVGWLGNGTNLV